MQSGPTNPSPASPPPPTLTTGPNNTNQHTHNAWTHNRVPLTTHLPSSRRRATRSIPTSTGGVPSGITSSRSGHSDQRQQSLIFQSRMWGATLAVNSSSHIPSVCSGAFASSSARASSRREPLSPFGSAVEFSATGPATGSSSGEVMPLLAGILPSDGGSAADNTAPTRRSRAPDRARCRPAGGPSIPTASQSAPWPCSCLSSILYWMAEISLSSSFGVNSPPISTVALILPFSPSSTAWISVTRQPRPCPRDGVPPPRRGPCERERPVLAGAVRVDDRGPLAGLVRLLLEGLIVGPDPSRRVHRRGRRMGRASRGQPRGQGVG